MRRRTRLSRREIAFYRISFLLVIIVASFVIIKGIVVLASDSITTGAKKFGVSMVQSIYLSITSNENHVFSYVAEEETTKSTVLSTIVEDVALNHYATHQGKIILDEENMEDEWYQNIDEQYADEALLISDENQNSQDEMIAEGEEDVIILDSELLDLAEQENQTVMNNQSEEHLIVEYLPGEVEMLPEYIKAMEEAKNGKVLTSEAISVSKFINSQYDMSLLLDFDYLISNFYVVDASTKASKEVFQPEKLINMNLSIEKDSYNPQILIYHTHASEAYIDSKPGIEADTVVGAGNYLAELLMDMGYVVYHDTTAYDRLPNGDSNRNYAYSTARPQIEKILETYPSIVVTIDLHRDSGNKRVTTINGKDTAQIMLFNGLSRNQSGVIPGLENPNQQANLAFSLQNALVGRKLYPGLITKNYLKNYRYNLHFKERSLLIELGTVNNTVMEAYNAMEPLANILNQVLSNP